MMADGPQRTSATARPLRADDVGRLVRPSLAANPAMARLGSALAQAIAAALSSRSQAAWRLALEGVEESQNSGTEGEWSSRRAESSIGSVALRQGVDLQMLSAYIEAALGGTGAGVVFDLSTRPLSAIEREFLTLLHADIEAGAQSALSEVFTTRFSMFATDEDDRTGKDSADVISFRFVANVFSYSGDLRLLLAREDLARQIAALEATKSKSRESDDGRAALQMEIGKSVTTLKVVLPPEQRVLDEILQLKPGSLLRLAARASDPVIVASGARPIYAAGLARAGDRLAVKIMGGAA